MLESLSSIESEVQSLRIQKERDMEPKAASAAGASRQGSGGGILGWLAGSPPRS